MANAARHFPLKTTQKALDVTMLMLVAGSIEVPRIVLSMQLARSPQRPLQRPQAVVYPFPTAPAPPATSTAATVEGAGAAPPIADAPPDYSADMDAIGGEPAA
jgi:hypothetical protein